MNLLPTGKFLKKVENCPRSPALYIQVHKALFQMICPKKCGQGTALGKQHNPNAESDWPARRYDSSCSSWTMLKTVNTFNIYILQLRNDLHWIIHTCSRMHKLIDSMDQKTKTTKGWTSELVLQNMANLRLKNLRLVTWLQVHQESKKTREKFVQPLRPIQWQSSRSPIWLISQCANLFVNHYYLWNSSEQRTQFI